MAAKRFVLAGHGGFYNRGCEAIVRTTASLLREQFPECEIALISNDAVRDRAHPAGAGLHIMDTRAYRWSPEWFGWQARKLLRQPIPPREQVPRAPRRAVRDADAVLQIGGDNFTSDYGLHPHSPLLVPNDIARENDIPLVFWGASVGPFDSAELERLVLDHLRRAALITVRESVSADYLADRGISDNVVRVSDPAMILEPSPLDLSPFWPEAERVLGLNLSPLSCRYRSDGDMDFGRKLGDAVINEVLRWEGWGVLLVPHVTGVEGNDDYLYMAPLAECSSAPERVRLCPPVLNAAETKYVVSQFDMLMAARTHATIAAFSTGVPTISLAYSRKAHGINLDLFGHTEWLLDIVQMPEPQEAVAAVRRLAEESDAVAAHLRSQGEEMRAGAKRGATALVKVLQERGR